MLGLMHIMRRVVRKLGFDVHRVAVSPNDQLVMAMKAHDISLVLDVGANAGQYAQTLRNTGYRGGIVSFEPLCQAHEELVRASAGSSNWLIAPRVAIGERCGTVSMNVAGNSASSSILPMLSSCAEADPDARYVYRRSRTGATG
jgi:hypothetical protein